MGLFQKKIGPVFLKENSEVSEFIAKMNSLSEEVSPKIKEEVDRQIKLAAYGEAGEKNIAYELKNSGLDMYILHDIYLEQDELSAQIDYLIVCRKKIYVLECKNLIGDIEVDSNGQFIRKYEINGKKYKESIYSPITQNERHLNVLKEVRKASKSNFLTKQLFLNNFEKNYQSVVVLANPKSCLNDKYAKKEIKQKVIRADQLISFIKKCESESEEPEYFEKDMREIAEFYLSRNVPNKSDYSKKYEEFLKVEKENVIKAENNGELICPKCGSKLVVRTAKKGANMGSQFYGCSNYPNCKYTKNL